MAMLDHWHPVLRSRELRRRPIAVRLACKDLVLFRAENGQTAALENVCPHRRMRLSMGTVVKHRLQCLYHGWTYDRCGNGESPGTPKLHACAEAFDTREERGVIWVKPRGVEAAFPRFDIEGYYHLCTLMHRVKAPLDLVVDNFCEIEHTPTTHAFFGYDLPQMHKVEVRFEPTDTTVRVINAGPCKPVRLIYRLLLGIRKHYVFNDDWTTYFSPVYSVYDHWWSDPATGREGMVRWRLYIFFTPVDEQETALTTLAFTRSRYPGPAGGVRLLKWLITGKLDHEIRLDMRILENLANKDPSIEGMKLSRFDKVLGLNRERIERIYRGNSVSSQAHRRDSVGLTPGIAPADPR